MMNINISLSLIEHMISEEIIILVSVFLFS